MSTSFNVVKLLTGVVATSVLWTGAALAQDKTVTPPAKPDAPKAAPAKPAETAKPMTKAPASANPKVMLSTTAGDVELELYPDKAPNTVAKITELIGKGFYNGLKFHRVIPIFMVQGGDPKGDCTGGPGFAFDDEISDLKFDAPGVLAMANAGTQNGHGTNGSQFFVTVAATPWLNGKHTIFGKVIKGYEIIEKISKMDRDERDRPKTEVVMTKVTLEGAKSMGKDMPKKPNMEKPVKPADKAADTKATDKK